jgi:hypothetical protein
LDYFHGCHHFYHEDRQNHRDQTCGTSHFTCSACIRGQGYDINGATQAKAWVAVGVHARPGAVLQVDGTTPAGASGTVLVKDGAEPSVPFGLTIPVIPRTPAPVFGSNLVLQRLGLSGASSPIFAEVAPSLGLLLAVPFLLALAEAFRRGAELAKDVEGLV